MELAAHDTTHDDPATIDGFGNATGGKVGMWVFIAQDGMAFGGLLLAYGILRAASPEWPNPDKVLGIGLTAVATFDLIVSSMFMVFAVMAAQARDQKRLVFWLLMTIFGGLAFLGIQAYEYTHLGHQGIHFAESTYQYLGETINPLFGSTFYAVTGFHGLHVTAGVIYLICILVGAMKGKYTKGGLSYSPVELVGLFWHFVDLVWILVFTLIYLLRADMAATIKKADVVTVIIILGLLTAAEVAVPWAYDSEYDKYLKVSLLVILAAGKAWLVALYFMHLKWEQPWLKRIALMPIYIAVFACLLMLESVYR